MNVLFVHDHRFYECNGKYYSTKFSQQTWEPYLQDENQVMVYARKTTKPCTQLASTNSRVCYFLSNYFSSPFSAVKHVHKIWTELSELIQKSDRVIVRLPSISGIIATRIAITLRKKIMAEVVGDAYDAYRYYGNISGVIFAPIFKFLTQKAIQKVDAVLYVTKEYLQRLYPSNALICACSDALIAPVPNEILDIRIKKIEDSQAVCRCGTVGNISMPYKGYEIMLKAMSILKNKGIIITFHVVGGGNPDNFYSQAQSFGVLEQVYYDGVIDHSRIAEFYDSLDIYVHPSYTEGLPRSVIEAISRGCPCLVSRAGGTPELVNHGCIHNIKDAAKLAADIERLYTEKNLRKQLAVENFNHAKQYYDNYLIPKRMKFYEAFFKI